MNEHWLVELADGERAFLKAGHVDPSPRGCAMSTGCTASSRATSCRSCSATRTASSPLLILEYIVDAWWPPPWRDEDVAAVQVALEEIAAR